jgi:hypothetical protein
MHGVLRCAFSSILENCNCNSRRYTTALLLAAGVRLAPTVAAASSAARVFYVGDEMMRRALEVAPDGIHSIAVADVDFSALDDVVRTQPNSIRAVNVDDTCAKLTRVCAVWGPTSLRDVLVVAEADPVVIEEALAHCTGGLTHLRVPHAAILAPAYARSLAFAPPAWMATVRQLSVAIASNRDLAALPSPSLRRR